MFWLLKKIVGIVILVVLITFALRYEVKGRPVQDYLTEFYRSPLVQELVRQGKEALAGFLHKEVTPPGPPQEEVNNKERREIERVMEKQLNE